jgi:hypothetical protein
MVEERKTPNGRFFKDESGLWHFRNESIGSIETAAADALRNQPGATWFWFNETPCPMVTNDIVETLTARWDEWRDVFEKCGGRKSLRRLYPFMCD